jgi:hypothetical protein
LKEYGWLPAGLRPSLTQHDIDAMRAPIIHQRDRRVLDPYPIEA